MTKSKKSTKSPAKKSIKRSSKKEKQRSKAAGITNYSLADNSAKRRKALKKAVKLYGKRSVIAALAGKLRSKVATVADVEFIKSDLQFIEDLGKIQGEIFVLKTSK